MFFWPLITDGFFQTFLIVENCGNRSKNKLMRENVVSQKGAPGYGPSWSHTNQLERKKNRAKFRYQ